MTGRPILFVSLAVNLFLAGALSVLLLAHFTSPRRPPPGPLRQVAQALDPAHRQALVEVLRENGRAVRPMNLEARSLRADVWRQMASPNFDPVQLKAELARARQLGSAASGRVQDALVDYAATLPPDQRQALAQALARRMPPPPGARPPQVLPPSVLPPSVLPGRTGPQGASSGPPPRPGPPSASPPS
ncbi:MAG: periplasmic heavy metal sensor [Alphaproteobacteria bacterium]|nr:periplasmic heavy metal sensor [Alphaproteobacteria bacterium]